MAPKNLASAEGSPLLTVSSNQSVAAISSGSLAGSTRVTFRTTDWITSSGVP
jgi:hypothetical protein